ncbi:hypothetical protein [Candidatus Gromoviella agglomerans]|uniref:hypothetical protein n=1 Tax=Candidatus Gromoviella agglomerans TaxID=2806609 RepID=UPI001E430D47|nr:hypothetical protein [Candidatus Gromoviella agglomerans]UFX98157.1 hypothetical protein Gromo_00037 [Candidatus Gromoviella agglomerans]
MTEFTKRISKFVFYLTIASSQINPACYKNDRCDFNHNNIINIEFSSLFLQNKDEKYKKEFCEKLWKEEYEIDRYVHGAVMSIGQQNKSLITEYFSEYFCRFCRNLIGNIKFKYPHYYICKKCKCDTCKESPVCHIDYTDHSDKDCCDVEFSKIFVDDYERKIDDLIRDKRHVIDSEIDFYFDTCRKIYNHQSDMLTKYNVNPQYDFLDGRHWLISGIITNCIQSVESDEGIKFSLNNDSQKILEIFSRNKEEDFCKILINRISKYFFQDLFQLILRKKITLKRIPVSEENSILDQKPILQNELEEESFIQEIDPVQFAIKSAEMNKEAIRLRYFSESHSNSIAHELYFSNSIHLMLENMPNCVTNTRHDISDKSLFIVAIQGALKAPNVLSYQGESETPRSFVDIYGDFYSFKMYFRFILKHLPEQLNKISQELSKNRDRDDLMSTSQSITQQFVQSVKPNASAQISKNQQKTEKTVSKKKKDDFEEDDENKLIPVIDGKGQYRESNTTYHISGVGTFYTKEQIVHPSEIYQLVCKYIVVWVRMSDRESSFVDFFKKMEKKVNLYIQSKYLKMEDHAKAAYRGLIDEKIDPKRMHENNAIIDRIGSIFDLEEAAMRKRKTEKLRQQIEKMKINEKKEQKQNLILISNDISIDKIEELFEIS